MDKLMGDIIQGLCKGDEKAFEELFHLCYNKLLLFAKAYVIHKEAAREIVQEAFIKMWENRSRLRPDFNPEAYLFTIVRNNSLNYLKHCIVERKYSQSAHEQMEHYQLHYAALKNDTIEQLYFAEVKEILDRAINELPPRCKKVFELSRRYGMKNKEIAEKMNISVKTVENHMTEALKRLRTAVGRYL
jgi:RNA polymerase sigma-70 factor (ECF subfamily)